MKISLFQGILFGVFGLGALIGLFVFATYSGNNNGGDNVGKVVIWGTLPKDGVQMALTNSAQNEVLLKNVSYVQKDSSTLPNDLATAIATGSSPDLILTSQEELLSLSKFITRIPPSTLPASTFTNAFIAGSEVFSSSAGYYGIPFLVDPLVLFSNRSILSSEGIAKPPSTWESMVGLVPNVAILTSSRQITRGLIALGTYDNVHNARGILSALFIQTGITISSYSSSGIFSYDLGGDNVSRGASLGEAVIGFYTQFADPSKVSYTWNASMSDSQQEFLTGDLALYIGFASEARFFKSANPNLDFIVSPIPQPATSKVNSTYGLIYAFMIPTGSKNPSGAYQSAALLTNSPEQIASASATGLAPVTLNELTNVPNDSVSSVAYAGALYSKGWMSPAPRNTDIVFSGMIGDVINGRSTLSSALASAERSLSALLQK